MAETDTLVVTVSSLPVVQDRTEVQTVRGAMFTRVSAATLGSVAQRAAALRRHAEQTKLPLQRASEDMLIDHGWIAKDAFYARTVAHVGDEAMVLWGRAAEVLAELRTSSAVAADQLETLACGVYPLPRQFRAEARDQRVTPHVSPGNHIGRRPSPVRATPCTHRPGTLASRPALGSPASR